MEVDSRSAEEVSPQACRRDLLIGREIAIIDLREEQAFGEAHPLFAANLPLSTLELTAPGLLPRRDVRIVLYDDRDGDLAARGTRTLRGLGYTDVRRLAGGLEAWRQAGYELFSDLSSYAKAFGELVVAECATPNISADELQALMAADTAPVLIDVRPAEEFAAGCVPGAINVPGVELPLHLRRLCADPDRLVVVTCAGRTRGLIAAQTLIGLGLANPVAALRDGAMGWRLTERQLSADPPHRLPAPRPGDIAEIAAHATAGAYRSGVRRVSMADLAARLRDADRTIYRYDVRPRDAFLHGHPPGFRHAPGGQLVQETDRFAPVRGAVIALWDDLGVRSAITAAWLVQMGFEAVIVDAEYDGPLETGDPPVEPPPLPRAATMGVGELASALARGEVLLIDLASSRVHARGHIPGARFAVRSRLPRDLPAGSGPVVLTSEDGVLAAFAAAELATGTGRPVLYLEGGTDAWRRQEQRLDPGLDDSLSPPIDVYRRPHESTDPAASMRAYLDWEHGLVAQLARDGAHGFRIQGRRGVDG